MSLARLRHELRILGAFNLALPLIVAAIYLGFTVLVYYMTLRNGGTVSDAHFQASRGLLDLLENGLPLAAGLVVTMLISQDPAMELHLSLPATYRGTAVRRLVLMIVWAVLFTAAVSIAIAISGYWLLAQFHLQSVPQDQLTWLTPLFWFIAAGAVLALLLRSRTASSAILGMIWIAQFLFKPLFLSDATLQKVYLFLTEEEGAPSYWLANRLILLALALLFFCATIWLLGRNEALLGSES